MIQLRTGLALLLWAIPADAQVVPQVLRGVDARSAALLLSGQRGGSVRAAVAASPVTAAEEGGCQLHAWLEVDGQSLVGEQPHGHVDVELSIYAMAAAGRVTAFDRVLLPLDLHGVGASLRRHGVRIHRRLPVPCDSHTLRVLVRNVGNDAFFLGEAQAPLAGQGWIAQILASPSPWLEVGGGERPASSPAARVLLHPGSRLSLALYPTDGVGDGFEVRGRLVAPGGDATATPMRQSGAGGAPGHPRVLEWLVPGDAAQGSAELELTISTATDHVALRLPVSVGRADGPPTWLAASPEAETATPPAELPLPVARVRAEYLSVLRLLAGHEFSRALSATVALQRRVLGDGTAARREHVARAILGVAAELAEQGGWHLPPLLWLHLEAFHSFVNAREHVHAAAAADHVVSLAGLCHRGRCQESVRSAAGLALASLGEAHAQRASWQSAMGYFRRALALAPGLDEASLGAAAVAEWMGEYREVVDILGGQEPRAGVAGEALLRLGVNLQRLGEERRARAALQRCAEGGEPEWTRVVALEELARMDLAAGRAKEAVALLRAAVDSLPHEPSLRVLLAHALESSGDVAAATALFNELAAMPGRSGATPRLRYTRRAEEDSGARRRLREAAQGALPGLAAALDRREEQR